MSKKMENKTLVDVKNMKFDHPLDDLDIFIGISERAPRERETKAFEEEENPVDISKRVKKSVGSSSSMENEKYSLFKKPADRNGEREAVEGKSAFDERERFKSVLTRAASTLIKNPAGTTARKKMIKVMPRDMTRDDTKHLKNIPYGSDKKFDMLVDIAMVAKKLRKEEAKKLMISISESEEGEDHEEEEEEEEEHSNDISKNSVINRAYAEEGREKFSTSPRGEEVFFCCPTPQAAAKRKRSTLARENCLNVLMGERLMTKKSLKNPAVADENPKRVMRRTKTSKTKEIIIGAANGEVLPDGFKPELPEDIMEKIREENGSDVKLVIQKRLTRTDLEPGQNRVSLPFSMLNRTDFLTESEEEFLNGRGDRAGTKLNGIDVLFIEPNGDKNLELVFKRWEMPKPKNGGGKRNVSTVYLFNGKWNFVNKKHRLDRYMIMQVWSFRYNGGKLGFAMVIIGSVVEEEGNRNRNNRNGNERDNESGFSESWSGDGCGTGGSAGATPSDYCVTVLPSEPSGDDGIREEGR